MKIWIKIVGGLVAVTAVFLAACHFYIDFSTKDYIKSSISDLPYSQAVIILGAGVLRNGQLSQVLYDRSFNALQIFKSGKASQIFVSGNNISPNNEVGAAKAFLLNNNVKQKDIILDNEGFDTYTSMYNAKNRFNLSSVIIPTQDFHLPRAVYIARRLGLGAYGYKGEDKSYSLKNNLREFFADAKAVIDIVLKRKP